MILIVSLVFVILFLYLKYYKVEKYFNYITELSNNDENVQLFCKKLNLLNNPNEHNLLQKKFLDELKEKNNEQIKNIESQIHKLNKENTIEYINKKNRYKLDTHRKANKQLNAIKKAKENINSNNKVFLNLT